MLKIQGCVQTQKQDPITSNLGLKTTEMHPLEFWRRDA